MADDNNYNDGDVVWVKLGNNWWPGEVIGAERQPEGLVKHLKRKPYCVVKFFNEDTYEYVYSPKKILPYQCLKKDEFIKKGYSLFNSKNKFMEKFPADIELAEQLSRRKNHVIIYNRPDSIVKVILGQPLVHERHCEYGFSSSQNSDSFGYLPRRNSNTQILDLTPNVNNTSIHKSGFPMINNATNSNSNANPKSTPASLVNADFYQCNMCNFTSFRQNVMILHRKMHGDRNTNSTGSIFNTSNTARSSDAIGENNNKVNTKAYPSLITLNPINATMQPQVKSAILTTQSNAVVQEHDSSSHYSTSTRNTSASKTLKSEKGETKKTLIENRAMCNFYKAKKSDIVSPGPSTFLELHQAVAPNRLPKKKELASLALCEMYEKDIITEDNDAETDNISESEEVSEHCNNIRNSSLVPTRDGEEIQKILLADWSDEEDISIDIETTFKGQSDSIEDTASNYELASNSEQLRTTVDSKTLRRIRNIPKKDRRDVVLQDFKNDLSVSECNLGSPQTQSISNDTIITLNPCTIVDSGSNCSDSSLVEIIEEANLSSIIVIPDDETNENAKETAKHNPNQYMCNTLIMDDKKASLLSKTSADILSCFDFEEEEEEEEEVIEAGPSLDQMEITEDDTAAQNKLSPLQKDYDEIAKNDEKLTKQIEDLLDDPVVRIPNTESTITSNATYLTAEVLNKSEESEVSVKDLPIKERGKRIFKSRNRTRTEECLSSDTPSSENTSIESCADNDKEQYENVQMTDTGSMDISKDSEFTINEIDSELPETSILDKNKIKIIENIYIEMPADNMIPNAEAAYENNLFNIEANEQTSSAQNDYNIESEQSKTEQGDNNHASNATTASEKENFDLCNISNAIVDVASKCNELVDICDYQKRKLCPMSDELQCRSITETPTDENSSFAASDTGAEFGSPASMLDEERMPTFPYILETNVSTEEMKSNNDKSGIDDKVESIHVNDVEITHSTVYLEQSDRMNATKEQDAHNLFKNGSTSQQQIPSRRHTIEKMNEVDVSTSHANKKLKTSMKSWSLPNLEEELTNAKLHNIVSVDSCSHDEDPHRLDILECRKIDLPLEKMESPNTTEDLSEALEEQIEFNINENNLLPESDISSENRDKLVESTSNILFNEESCMSKASVTVEQEKLNQDTENTTEEEGNRSKDKFDSEQLPEISNETDKEFLNVESSSLSQQVNDTVNIINDCEQVEMMESQDISMQVEEVTVTEFGVNTCNVESSDLNSSESNEKQRKSISNHTEIPLQADNEMEHTTVERKRKCSKSSPSANAIEMELATNEKENDSKNQTDDLSVATKKRKLSHNVESKTLARADETFVKDIETDMTNEVPIAEHSSSVQNGNVIKLKEQVNQDFIQPNQQLTASPLDENRESVKTMNADSMNQISQRNTKNIATSTPEKKEKTSEEVIELSSNVGINGGLGNDTKSESSETMQGVNEGAIYSKMSIISASGSEEVVQSERTSSNLGSTSKSESEGHSVSEKELLEIKASLTDTTTQLDEEFLIEFDSIVNSQDHNRDQVMDEAPFAKAPLNYNTKEVHDSNAKQTSGSNIAAGIHMQLPENQMSPLETTNIRPKVNVVQPKCLDSFEKSVTKGTRRKTICGEALNNQERVNKATLPKAYRKRKMSIEDNITSFIIERPKVGEKVTVFSEPSPVKKFELNHQIKSSDATNSTCSLTSSTAEIFGTPATTMFELNNEQLLQELIQTAEATTKVNVVVDNSTIQNQSENARVIDEQIIPSPHLLCNNKGTMQQQGNLSNNSNRIPTSWPSPIPPNTNKQIGIDSRGNKYVIIKTPVQDLKLHPTTLNKVQPVKKRINKMTNITSGTNQGVGAVSHLHEDMNAASLSTPRERNKFIDSNSVSGCNTNQANKAAPIASKPKNERHREAIAALGRRLSLNTEAQSLHKISRTPTTIAPKQFASDDMAVSGGASVFVHNQISSKAQQQFFQLQQQQMLQPTNITKLNGTPQTPLQRKLRKFPHNKANKKSVTLQPKTQSHQLPAQHLQPIQPVQQPNQCIQSHYTNQNVTQQQLPQNSICGYSEEAIVSQASVQIEESIDQTSKILAVPTHPIPGFSETFLLCTLVENTYKPINNVPLYLNHDLNQLVPVPLEILKDEPRLIVSHPITQSIEQLPYQQILKKTEVSDLSGQILNSVQPLISNESNNPVAVETPMIVLPQQLTEEVISDNAGGVALVGGNQLTIFGSNEENTLVPNNAIILNIENQQIILDAATFAHLLANPDANTQLVTDDGTEFVLTREVLSALQLQHDAQAVEVAVAQHQHQHQQQISVQASSNDILAVALAGSNLYGGDVLEIDTSQGLQLLGNGANIVFQPTTSLTQPHLTPPMQAHVSETNALLDQTPIMSTLESPSTLTVGRKNKMTPLSVSGALTTLLTTQVSAGFCDNLRPNLEDSLAAIGVTTQTSTIPSFELPITVTNPNIAPKANSTPPIDMVQFAPPRSVSAAATAAAVAAAALAGETRLFTDTTS